MGMMGYALAGAVEGAGTTFLDIREEERQEERDQKREKRLDNRQIEGEKRLEASNMRLQDRAEGIEQRREKRLADIRAGEVATATETRADETKAANEFTSAENQKTRDATSAENSLKRLHDMGMQESRQDWGTNERIGSEANQYGLLGEKQEFDLSMQTNAQEHAVEMQDDAQEATQQEGQANRAHDTGIAQMGIEAREKISQDSLTVQKEIAELRGVTTAKGAITTRKNPETNEMETIDNRGDYSSLTPAEKLARQKEFRAMSDFFRRSSWATYGTVVNNQWTLGSEDNQLMADRSAALAMRIWALDGYPANANESWHKASEMVKAEPSVDIEKLQRKLTKAQGKWWNDEEIADMEAALANAKANNANIPVYEPEEGTGSGTGTGGMMSNAMAGDGTIDSPKKITGPEEYEALEPGAYYIHNGQKAQKPEKQ